MTLKDHNYLKNVYLLSVVYHDKIGKVIETFDNKTSNKTELKKEIVLLMDGKCSVDKKWDSLLNPKYFSEDLKTVLEKLKGKRQYWKSF